MYFKLSFCICFFMGVVGTLADDWPHFRGPHYTGTSTEKGLKLNFSTNKPTRLWRAKVKVGFSSISSSQGKLYTMGHSGGKDYVFCLDENTGKEIWSKSYKGQLQPNMYEGGPNTTPTIFDGLVYTLGKHGQFYCFDARTGKEKWSIDVSKEYNFDAPAWGFSGSPFISDDLVIINAGSSGIAFNRKSGKLAWKSAGGATSYATPVPYGKSILLFTVTGLVNLVPKTGKKIWSYPWKTSHKINSADPVFDKDLIFISSGYGRGASVIKASSRSAKKVWEHKEMRNHFSSSVLHNGYIYGIDGNTDSGDSGLKCIELKSGKVQWEEEVGFGSLMLAGDTLLVLRSKGQLLSVKATPSGYQNQGKIQVLGGKCWTSPIISNGKFIARNAKGDLVCFKVN
jgi:outer membrane protein assembly factor BamB